MAKETDKLRVEAGELRAQASVKEDRSFGYGMFAIVVAVVGTFGSVVTFVSWYMDAQMKNAGTWEQAGYALMLTLFCGTVLFLARSIWLLHSANRLRHRANNLISEADDVDHQNAAKDLAAQRLREADELEQVQETERQRLAEQAAREEAARARVAEVIEKTRDELRAQQGRPSVAEQRKSEAANRPKGGTPYNKGR